MTQHPSGPCIREGCDEPGGHGPRHALCADHAASAAESAAQIISRAAPQRMTMHEGAPATVSCGHTISAGDHVVSVGGEWICETCASGKM